MPLGVHWSVKSVCCRAERLRRLPPDTFVHAEVKLRELCDCHGLKSTCLGESKPLIMRRLKRQWQKGSVQTVLSSAIRSAPPLGDICCKYECNGCKFRVNASITCIWQLDAHERDCSSKQAQIFKKPRVCKLSAPEPEPASAPAPIVHLQDPMCIFVGGHEISTKGFGISSNSAGLQSTLSGTMTIATPVCISRPGIYRYAKNAMEAGLHAEKLLLPYLCDLFRFNLQEMALGYVFDFADTGRRLYVELKTSGMKSGKLGYARMNVSKVNEANKSSWAVWYVWAFYDGLFAMKHDKTIIAEILAGTRKDKLGTKEDYYCFDLHHLVKIAHFV